MLPVIVAASMNTCKSASGPDPADPLDQIESTLYDLLHELEPPSPSRPPRGRPPLMPALLLWAGLLVCILRGFSSQLAIWRLLTQHGLWRFPRLFVSDMAVYQRLQRTPAAHMQQLFQQVTAVIRARLGDCRALPQAAFASEIVAVDQTTLDPVLRKTKLLRDCPQGDHRLLPGALNCLFDLRRQQWWRVEFVADPHQNEKAAVRALIDDLPPGALLLFDLGYFSFAWFDHLTDTERYFVSRLRAQTSYETVQVLFQGSRQGVEVRDSWIYLGAYRADRAAHPLRLVEVKRGQRTHRYLTNVMDPQQLPVRDLVELYRRRWTIEMAFNLLKTHLGLHLLWSSHANVVLHQVFASLIIAQIVLAFQVEVARRAEAEVREVSLPLLIQWLPQYGARGEDPLARLAAEGRRSGIIRPFRGQEYQAPAIAWRDYAVPEALPPPRRARYAGRKCGPRRRGRVGT